MASLAGNGAPKSMLLKVVILGDGGVGKSSLMNRFVNNEFDAQSFHTIGVEFLNKIVALNGDSYTLQIWDTAGQERFKSLRTPFYRGADCCLLVFGIDDEQSFRNLTMWKKEFLYYADVADPEHFPFVVVGNKVDVGARQVRSEDAEAWCKANGGLAYFETSAKEAIKVEQAFLAAATQVPKSDGPMSTDYSNTVNLSETPGKSSCCFS